MIINIARAHPREFRELFSTMRGLSNSSSGLYVARRARECGKSVSPWYYCSIVYYCATYIAQIATHHLRARARIFIPHSGKIKLPQLSPLARSRVALSLCNVRARERATIIWCVSM